MPFVSNRFLAVTVNCINLIMKYVSETVHIFVALFKSSPASGQGLKSLSSFHSNLKLQSSIFLQRITRELYV